MDFICDIKIEGGVHNDTRTNYAPSDLPEEKLRAMVGELGDVIHKYTKMDSWIEVKFNKSIGTKRYQDQQLRLG
jgi:hypothetical protein